MLPPVDYLLIGHMTVDLIPTGRCLGGTVSYAARTAHAFGLKVGAVTSTAEGEPLLDELAQYVSQLVVLPAQSSTTFENIYTPTGRKQYIRGVAAPIGPKDIPSERLNVPLVHLAPIADEIDPQVAYRFKSATVLLTLQGWLRRWDESGLVAFKRWHDPEVLKAIDIVVFSEEDILAEPQLEQEFAASVRHLIVTRAENGGTYYFHGKPVTYDTPQVEVMNPTGAGDVFAASILAGLHLLGGDMDAAIRVAARLGATSTTRMTLDGAPTPQEVEQALAAVRAQP